MLPEDIHEPLAREIAHFLAHVRAPIASSWVGYTRDEDLVPLKRKSNDAVEYVRASNGEARFRLNKLREQEPHPDSIVVHPEIVLESKPAATATVEIDNRLLSIPSEAHTFAKQFKDGESEQDALATSMVNEVWGQVEASAKAGIGVAEAEAKASAGWKNTITLAWNRQTGRTRETTAGGTFPFRAPPYTLVEFRLQWNIQTKQRRLECDAVMDAEICFGRRSKPKGKGWRWNSGSPMSWDSIEHLLAVAHKRGRVEHALYEFFSHRALDGEANKSLRRIYELRQRHVDRLTDPYTGASDIKVGIVRLEQALPE